MVVLYSDDDIEESYKYYLLDNYGVTLEDSFESEECPYGEFVEMYRDNAREEMENIELDGRILVLGDLGLWRGRRNGYKVIDDIECIYELLQVSHGDNIDFYADNEDLKMTDCHHDGTNYYIFRLIKNNVEDDDLYELLDDICSKNRFDKKLIDKYTESITPIVYKYFGVERTNPAA